MGTVFIAQGYTHTGLMLQQTQDLHDSVSVQAWPEDASESQPKSSWWLESQAPSEEAGHHIDDPPHTEQQVRALKTEQLLQNRCHADTIPAPSRSDS